MAPNLTRLLSIATLVVSLTVPTCAADTRKRIVRLIVDLTLQSQTCESISNSLCKAQAAKGLTEAQPEIKVSLTETAELAPKIAASKETLAKISDYCELLRHVRELIKDQEASGVPSGKF